MSGENLSAEAVQPTSGVEDISGIRRLHLNGVPAHFVRKSLCAALDEAGYSGMYRNTRCPPKHTIGIVTFDSTEQLDRFVKKLDAEGLTFNHGAKTTQATYKIIAPEAETARNESRMRAGRARKEKPNPFAAAGLTPSGHSSAPWSNIPYALQLDAKAESVREALRAGVKNVRRQVRKAKSVSGPPHWIRGAYLHHLLTFGCEPSPSTTEYRNKVEFVVGKDRCGDVSVGSWQRVATADGSLASIEAPTAASSPHIPVLTIELASTLTQYLRSAGASPFARDTREGVWRALRMRVPQLATEAPVLVCVETTSAADAVQVAGALRALCGACERPVIPVHIVYDGISDFSADAVAELRLFHADTGDFEPYVPNAHSTFEKLLGLEFAISARAFFQVNSPAAELLYSYVADQALSNHPDVVLDVCCGTGTIGCIVASQNEGKELKVCGVDICEPAVEDANANAARNGLRNVSFVAGPAQDVLPKKISEWTTCGTQAPVCTAVVDPPRAGLHASVIGALRANSAVERVVYVACAPSALSKDLVDLCHPTTNKRRGVPFVPVSTWTLDQFPMTPHVETVMVLERAADAAGALTESQLELAQAATEDYLKQRR